MVGKTLKEVAKQLKASPKKVQLIYAFNGTGKTRLSRVFKELIAPETEDAEDTSLSRDKILYYNAFTEDLFYWDNDLDNDGEPKLKIQPNSFTNWLIEILKDLGEDGNIVNNFQRHTGSKATPIFNESYSYKDKDASGKKVDVFVPALSEVNFQIAAGISDLDEDALDPIDVDKNSEYVSQGKYECVKISKGEESNFVWSVFYTLLEQVVSSLNETDPSNRVTDQFDNLEYVFIDDPVSSLDDSHLIELAVDLAKLIKESHFREGTGLKFIITTHNPLFYNVLHNEFSNDLENPAENQQPRWIYKRGQSEKYLLKKMVDGSYEISTSNDRPFSYHLFLLSEIKEAINSGGIRKYHFSFLRNILEKTATFLGYRHWEELIDKAPLGSSGALANRVLNLSSHSAHAGEEVSDVKEKDEEDLKTLMDYLIETYHFKEQEETNAQQ